MLLSGGYNQTELYTFSRKRRVWTTREEFTLWDHACPSRNISQLCLRIRLSRRAVPKSFPRRSNYTSANAESVGHKYNACEQYNEQLWQGRRLIYALSIASIHLIRCSTTVHNRRGRRDAQNAQKQADSPNNVRMRAGTKNKVAKLTMKVLLGSTSCPRHQKWGPRHVYKD
jgi:hypothetical protein